MARVIACPAPIGNSGLVASVIGSRRDPAKYEALYQWYEMQSLCECYDPSPVSARESPIVPGERRALLACS